MKFNLRFITTLILIVLIIISFVFIVLETLYFSNRKKLEIIDNGSTGLAIDTMTIAPSTPVKIKTPGPGPDKLVSDTQYYRYGSLLIHVLAMISGAYIVYSG